jgi:hypothetical protein
VPVSISPKLNLGGVTLSDEVGVVPVPARFTIVGVPDASLMMEIEPEAGPAAVGWKVIVSENC